MNRIRHFMNFYNKKAQKEEGDAVKL